MELILDPIFPSPAWQDCLVKTDVKTYLTVQPDYQAFDQRVELFFLQKKFMMKYSNCKIVNRYVLALKIVVYVFAL